MKKLCSKCNREKELVANFDKHNKSKDGFDWWCKKCKKEQSALYREKNKAKLNAISRKYHQDHKEEQAAKAKIYREQNQEHIRQKRKDYLPTRNKNIKERRKTDSDFRLTEILRSKIHKMIRGDKTSYQEWIGLPPDVFRRWLEFQFTPEMNWDNLGSYWHVDHILPLNGFDFSLEDHKYVGFGWTNLQPLHKFENQSKSDTYQLHYYYNSIISIHRFIQNEQLDISEYQRINESRSWIRNNLIEGKKLSG